MTHTSRFTIVPLLTLILCSSIFAQQTEEAPLEETIAEVPILLDLHEMIFKLWHTAWPEKNLAMLSELLPEIKHFSNSLEKVPLPGILRDKQNAWKQNTAKFREIASAYAIAASHNDSVALLNAAEKLHGQYEVLVRMTRPVLKEMDAFHQVLYMIYHHYLPENDQEMLASSAVELKKRMAFFDRASLPDRLKKRESAFMKARMTLSHSVEALEGSMAKTDLKEFTSMVESVHTDYRTLEGVLE